MEIKHNNEAVNYDITGLSWNDTNRIYRALKKISDLIGKTQFASEYHQQEAEQLRKNYEEIILVFDNCKDFPKGKAKGLEETILEVIENDETISELTCKN